MKVKRDCFVAVLLAMTTFAYADETSELLKQGKEAYSMHCARCHGDQGLGDGPDAKRVPVTPRNFTRGTYKFRTTASGSPPSDADLMYVIDHGLAGSGMPSFANLGLDVKKSLIAYVKSFSKEFETYQPQPLAEPNTKARADFAKGKEVYAKLQCALCHGEAGRANGTSAPTLVDSWGAPIKAADLNQEWTYRAGSSARDIYFRLMSGIAGTPMPSYDGAITMDEAWQLANYVVSLQEHANWSYNVIAQRTSQPLPAETQDEAWKRAPKSTVNLQSSYFAGGRRHAGAVKAVTVQAIVNGNEAAIRLSWNDTTKSSNDQLAVAFLQANAKGSERPDLATVSLDGAKGMDLMVWSPASSKGKAVFTDGQWALVFKHSVGADASSVPVAFAAWDGGSGEAGLKRSVSQWVPLVLASSHAGH